VLLASAAFAQQGVDSPNRPIGYVDTTNLPVQKIGNEDLLWIQVYDSPEWTRSVRVLEDGMIRLPSLKPVQAAGLFPVDVEAAIKDELKSEQLLVDPFVSVTILEYHSRPISVSGAVKNPTIFQAIGDVNLLDALAKAGGISDTTTAGGELIITRPNGSTGESIQRIPVRALIEGTDPALNVKLTGGEQIRVPVAATIIVSGNVVESGVFPVQDSGKSTVLTAIGQAKGLGMYRPTKAYIFRADATGTKHEIEVPLKAILTRKKPDVELQARDLLYIPNNRRGEINAQLITILSGVGASTASALVYTRNQGL